MWAANCSFHTAWGAKLLRTARGKSCHRKRATATAGKTEKVHSFEESTCRNPMAKGWRRERLSCRKPDMPCDTSVHLTLISLQQKHRGGVASAESALPITSSKTHLHSTDLLSQGRLGGAGYSTLAIKKPCCRLPTLLALGDLTQKFLEVPLPHAELGRAANFCFIW